MIQSESLNLVNLGIRIVNPTFEVLNSTSETTVQVRLPENMAYDH